MPIALYTERDRARITRVGSGRRRESYRTCWRQDYARLIHCAAFRRLQGKTQLYPGNNSDFFRNRLTHSLEVAQVAKSIAIKINHKHPYFRKNNIDTDLVETAALAHDLGHPPFGHNGEMALNECMRDAGGFEGNAQTLRILVRIEKRQTRVQADPDIHDSVVDGRDNRAGLNMTYRTLASVLKYDDQIPQLLPENARGGVNVVKGYYYTEAAFVENIKRHVRNDPTAQFKTIECSIMDIADDIAYSTYDLEDSFKAGFLTPLSMWTAPESVMEKVAAEVRARLNRYYPDAPASDRQFEIGDVRRYLAVTFTDTFDLGEDAELRRIARQHNCKDGAAIVSYFVSRASQNTADVGFYRTRFTSDLVGNFIRGVRVRFNPEYPMLSKAYLDIELFKKMEVLKNFAFQSIIMSPRLKVAEHRGKEIVKDIYDAIAADDGCLLMPIDFQVLYDGLEDPAEKRRVICDFIAGMTDRYAVEFYDRLYGTNPESIFTQH